jgi:hypothetical protein
MLCALAGCAGQVGQAPQLRLPPPAAQNPSPMTEETRAHERLVPRKLEGALVSFPGPAGRAVELFVPDLARRRDTIDLVVHFHGAAWLPQQAVSDVGNGAVAAVVNLGAGSGSYHRAFTDAAAFDSLLVDATREAAKITGGPVAVGRLTLTGFSAGHGAVRMILREPRHFARVNAVLLLDGMHTSYMPEGTVLASGGALDTTNLLAFAEFARAAMRGEKRFVVTHSEIFPGTFASTTETANWLVRTLGLRRTPVLQWGPRDAAAQRGSLGRIRGARLRRQLGARPRGPLPGDARAAGAGASAMRSGPGSRLPLAKGMLGSATSLQGPP